MIPSKIRPSFARRSAIAVALIAAAACLSQPRDARADDPAMPLQGSQGLPTLAGTTPLANSGEAVATVDPSTGAAHASFSFQLPVARGGAQPSLGLSYRSTSGICLRGGRVDANHPVDRAQRRVSDPQVRRRRAGNGFDGGSVRICRRPPRASLTQVIARQIAKDAELLQTGQVGAYTWHFFQSPVTGMRGPSGPLMQALQQAGISILVH